MAFTLLPLVRTHILSFWTHFELSLADSDRFSGRKCSGKKESYPVPDSSPDS